MNKKKSAPDWLTEAVDKVCSGRSGEALGPIALKLAGEQRLAPLWKKMALKFAGDDDFWGGPDELFRHLVLNVEINLRPPSGYKAMSPAKLDVWRKRTQSHALALLQDLAEGYPEITEKQDDAWIVDGWTTAAAVTVASKGEAESLMELFQLITDKKIPEGSFSSAMYGLYRPQVLINRLIVWLDFEAAKGHSVTSIRNAHRNSFIRRLTSFFELYLDSVMRRHVHCIAGLYFDMGELEHNDLKDIAPAGGGATPKVFIGNSPPEEDGAICP